MKTIDEISQELKSIHRAVHTAAAMLESGEVMELNEVENRVKAVCADIQSLPPNQRESTKRPLVSLLDDMDKFFEQLKIKHADLLKQIQSIAPQQSALKAYSKNQALPKDEE